MEKHDKDCSKQCYPCCEDLMCPCDLAEFKRLNAENARLRVALEYYADVDYWRATQGDDQEFIEHEWIQGKLARKALKGGE